MKKIILSGILLVAFLAISTTSFSQKKIKEGVVKFELDMSEVGDTPELAMMNGTSLAFYFKGKQQKMEMSMLGGMMKVQTIIPLDKPAEGVILMDMLGQKIEITGADEDALSANNSFMNMDNVASVTYDEKDKKEIAGYPCYLAKVKNKDGMEMKYYITEKIQPPVGVKNKDANVLKGYPLEMTMDSGQGFTMIFKAKEVSENVSDEVFKKGEGYTKMTMEEFTQQMGGMGLGGFGN